MEMLVADAEPDYTRHLGRNIVFGLVGVYAGTVGFVYLALDEFRSSAAIAVVPTLFAGPYVGILLTLVSAVSHGERKPSSATADTNG